MAEIRCPGCGQIVAIDYKVPYKGPAKPLIPCYSAHKYPVKKGKWKWCHKSTWPIDKWNQHKITGTKNDTGS